MSQAEQFSNIAVAKVLCFAKTHLQHDERCDHIVGHVEIVSSTGLVQRKPFQGQNNLTHIQKKQT